MTRAARVPGPWRPRLKLALSRCAWHRKHFGNTLWMRAAWWPGVGITVTDGICGGCLVLERAASRAPRSAAAPSESSAEGTHPRDGARGASSAIARAERQGFDEA